MIKCACTHIDSRFCFLDRYPECQRRDDSDTVAYDSAIDEHCDCACHRMDQDDKEVEE